MWCFAFSVSAVHNDSTVCVVSFDIAGTLMQKVGITLPASVALPPRSRFDELRFLRLLTDLKCWCLINICLLDFIAFGNFLHFVGAVHFF